MSKPVTKAATIVTEDGVPIDAVHLPASSGGSDLGIVVAHGLPSTGSGRRSGGPPPG